MTWAVVFPGMAPSNFAQIGGFMLASPHARRRAAEAGEVLGYDVVERFRESAADYSEYAQVAFVVNCLALADWAEQNVTFTPSVCVGPSFGGMAATAYTQALSYPDVLQLTARAARRELEFFEAAPERIVTHFFFRTPEARFDEILAETLDEGDWAELSSHMDEGFYAVCLREQSVERFKKRVQRVGGTPLYTMWPPAHCSVLADLRRLLAEEVFADFRFADPWVPLVSDLDGRLVDGGAEVRSMLLEGYVRPVRWPESVRTLRRLNVTGVCVPGPSNLFDRLTKRHFTEVTAVSPEKVLRAQSEGREQ